MSFRPAARQFFEKRGGAPTPPLPYDAEVEYLESTGTQWIDTGIKPNYDDVVRIELAVGTSSSLGRRFLFSDGNPNVAHYAEINGYNKYGVNNSRVIPVSFTVGNLYKAYAEFSGTLAKLGATINNSDYETSDTNYASPDWLYSLRLFRIDGTYAGSGSRIGRLSIKINGDIVFNSRPVRFTNEQGVSEGAMYDRVSGQLFRNADTGAFTIGPDKS
jgi:hypothetical protein